MNHPAVCRFAVFSTAAGRGVRARSEGRDPPTTCQRAAADNDLALPDPADDNIQKKIIAGSRQTKTEGGGGLIYFSSLLWLVCSRGYPDVTAHPSNPAVAATMCGHRQLSDTARVQARIWSVRSLVDHIQPSSQAELFTGGLSSEREGERHLLSSFVAPAAQAEYELSGPETINVVLKDKSRKEKIKSSEDLLCSHIGQAEKVSRNSGGSHLDSCVHTYTSSGDTAEDLWSSVHV
ncbi:unnamed protein product [Pleuronectes platessa]|uniref:Uncharacterized protein n=1 Tax=Pleuronectes platessa TaxID=8262 RepID=A0A9N7VMH5_PLEPL|nr:unnamed protein product [Pleuronectes platessa]